VEVLLMGEKKPGVSYYARQGGWGGTMGVSWNGADRFGFVFADSLVPAVGGYIDAFDKEGSWLHPFPRMNSTEQRMQPGDVLRDRLSVYHFAGIVCITEQGAEDHVAIMSAIAGYPAWMETSDAFQV
jgi:hypothetical protein